jgi:hypothetical protein
VPKEERRRKRKPLPEPEHTLLATVNTPEHLGKQVTCSLRCSRVYGRVDDPDEKRQPRIGKGQAVPERPFLLSIRLGKDGWVFSAYLSKAAYWALQADLKDRRLKFIRKPRRGAGDLTSINFSETAPAEP